MDGTLVGALGAGWQDGRVNEKYHFLLIMFLGGVFFDGWWLMDALYGWNEVGRVYFQLLSR